MMNAPDWDDGTYAPLFIRLAWHSSGTYDKATGTGGSNGAGMRYAVEAGDPENAGLGKAREILAAVQKTFSWLSVADLWILAAYVAIEKTGGPVIDFRGGRVDAPEEKAVAPGRLPGAEKGIAAEWDVDEEGRMKGWENLAQHIREVFGRMGLSDKEAVALIVGGHVYGRCHTNNSGYAGAWVENPTLFTNEYAADLIGDKWIPVTNDTRMPDGGPVPEEVRPAPGKRQYIDLTKYEPAEADKEERTAPDAKEFPSGQYRCVSQWVNVREGADVASDILGRIVKDEVVSLLAVKIFKTAARGLCERGGWISIVGTGGKTLFERVGDLDMDALKGRYRVSASVGCQTFHEIGGVASTGRVKVASEVEVSEIAMGNEGEQADAILGKRTDGGDAPWVLLFSPSMGVAAERIVEGYNDQPRKAITGQTGHQMMLVSDMVLLWDAEFRKHLQDFANDEEVLKKEFGACFQRLTELGCHWSADRVA